MVARAPPICQRRAAFAGAFQVVSGDANGTMIEIYPYSVQLNPEAGFTTSSSPAPYHPFHVLLSVPLDRGEIERIGKREGWRTEFCVAGAPGKPPAFHLLRMWVENRVLIEFVPEALIGEYKRYMQFERLDTLFEALPRSTPETMPAPPTDYTTLFSAVPVLGP